MVYEFYQFWLKAFQSQSSWAIDYSFFNIFRYITFRSGLSFFFSFFFVVFLGSFWTRFLLQRSIHHLSRSEGHTQALADFNKSKHNTPTMGGILIILSVLFSLLLFANWSNFFISALAFSLFSFGLLGFFDDFKKVSCSLNEGISIRGKIIWQIILSVLLVSFLFFKTQNSSSYFLEDQKIPFSAICFPLWKKPLFDLGIWIILFGVLVIVGCSNATNLTDGLDGLAVSCSCITALSYALIAYLAGHSYFAREYLSIVYHPQASEIALFLIALFGACLGFLWHNCYPAKIFMGDTGSLAIGASIGVCALAIKQELLLLIIGGIFVIEALSVIAQVLSFKLRKGKKIFAMTPIHHHFQLIGWHENQVIVRFLILALLLSFLGIGLLKVL